MRMEKTVRSVYWQAPEHHHIEKTGDWYWVLGIIAIAASIASIIFGNVLFGIVILLGSILMMLYAFRGPRVIPFEISNRGVRVDDSFYPYSVLESFYIDEEHYTGPQVLIKQRSLFSQLIIMPIPEEYLEEIEFILSSRLLEEHLYEPISHQLLEFFGF